MYKSNKDFTVEIKDHVTGREFEFKNVMGLKQSNGKLRVKYVVFTYDRPVVCEDEFAVEDCEVLNLENVEIDTSEHSTFIRKFLRLLK